MKNLTILIVEDDTFWQDLYNEICEDKCTLLQAFTLNQAEDLFLKNKKNLDLIILDGSLDDRGYIDTVELIKKIRKTSKIQMIAASGSTNSRKIMMQIGCHKEYDKPEVGEFLRNFLK